MGAVLWWCMATTVIIGNGIWGVPGVSAQRDHDRRGPVVDGPTVTTNTATPAASSTAGTGSTAMHTVAPSSAAVPADAGPSTKGSVGGVIFGASLLIAITSLTLFLVTRSMVKHHRLLQVRAMYSVDGVEDGAMERGRLWEFGSDDEQDNEDEEVVFQHGR